MAATFAEARPNTYDLQGSQYSKSNLFSTYRRDEGILVIPVMGPDGTPPVPVRVHASLGFRTVDFEYAREGSPPVFPAQADTDSGDIILASEVKLPAPVEVGARLIFGCKGSYEFLQFDRLCGTEEPYPIDRHPFLSLVDVLGNVNRYEIPFGDQGSFTTYNTSVMDSRYFSSYGIIR